MAVEVSMSLRIVVITPDVVLEAALRNPKEPF